MSGNQCQPLHDLSWLAFDEPTPLPHGLCRPLTHAGRAPPRNDIDGHDDRGESPVITAARLSNGPCRGCGRFADAGPSPDGRTGLPGTASRLGPSGWPPLARQTTSRRWPARSRCWLGLPILAASLPDTRDPSRHGCLARTMRVTRN